jgi:hypothetical protein
MILLGLLLALQQQDLEKRTLPPESDPKPGSQYHAGIGTDVIWWSARFDAQIRVDSDTSNGSSIDLVHDLKMSSERGIPIYGGGSIYIGAGHEEDPQGELYLTAEYWARTWNGSTTLQSDQVLGGVAFNKGTPVDSHFRLTSLDLGAGARGTNQQLWIRGGGQIYLHGTIGDLQISGAGKRKDVTVGEAMWGLGGFFEYRPWNILMGGASVKGYTDFTGEQRSSMGDLRAYAGVDWKFIRLEAGFRYMPFTESHPSDERFRFDLYGPYASISLSLNF